MKIQGIYKIRNCVNGKIYIGQSIDINHRFIEHKSNVNRNKRHPLYDSIRKHGIDNFEFFIIELVTDYMKLDEREQFWLDHYKSHNKEFGYNLLLVAGSNRGYKHTDETRKKVSDSLKGKKKPPRTEEHRKNISLAKKGKKQSEEAKRKNSESNKGRKHSKESCLKISKGHLGKKVLDSTKAKLSLIAKKQWENPEFRKAESNRMLKLWQDPIFREKMKQRKRRIKKINNLDLINQDVRLGTLPNLPLGSLDSGRIFN